jgi:N-acetylglucosamine kinase-like BadF-type ATPase
MGYIMSLDGGGTKLNCLVANEYGILVGIGKGGPTNSNYSSLSLIEESIKSAVSGALTSGNIDKNDVCTVNASLIMSGQWPKEVIKKLLHENVEINFFPEFVPSIYGAIQEDYGGLALSGTGSFASVRTKNQWITVGGWGDALGDEGSGYYIGHKALKACAQVEDGVLPDTLIKKQIQEIYKIDTMRKMVSELSNAPLGHQRTMIASFCPIVGWSADRGDAVAAGIIQKAAHDLALQLITAVKRCGKFNIPITVSGGAWKATPLFFSSFSEEIRQELPCVDIRPPLFEPVVGGILLGLRDLGFPVKENIETLKKTFNSFAYPERLFK